MEGLGITGEAIGLLILVGFVVLVIITIWILTLRRIVPTNVVHIVQRTKKTVSYGAGQKAGNVYYHFPKWMPFWGIDVRILPVSNFDLDLVNYSAYDKNRVPFLVDVKAFFRISDTNVAAQKVESFKELRDQLLGIVQGSVRSILAKSELELIMQERSIYGAQFTQDVQDDLANWGVRAVKPIELMDIHDTTDSNVIANIMAKKKSNIEMESRVEVAKNMKLAQEAEIEAKKEVSVKQAIADKETGEAQAQSDQKIGVAQAEADKEIGIAQQISEQKIQEQMRETEAKKMEVARVNQVRKAEIEKEALIVDAETKQRNIQIDADARKYALIVDAEAKQKNIQIDADAKKYEKQQLAEAVLIEKEKESEGIKLLGKGNAEAIKNVGMAEAEAEKLRQLASVTAQTELAKAIGENEGYQNYLIQIETLKVNKDIGIEYAKALTTADVKILANSGDVQSGMSSIKDIVSSKGGAGLVGLIEGLKQSETGSELVSGLLDKLKGEKK